MFNRQSRGIVDRSEADGCGEKEREDENMKFNLKNRPGKMLGDFILSKSQEKWFEGFEKELREKLDNIPNYRETTIQDSLVNALNDQSKKVIKEILGE